MIVSVQQVNRSLSKYDTIDESLISSRDYVRQFGLPEDYVEYHVYTKGEALLFSEYNYLDYRIPGNLQGGQETYTQELQFFPENIIENLGFTYGTYIVQFNVFRKKVVNINQRSFFIKEISTDRKELRISTNDFSNLTIEDGVVNFIYEIQNSQYFKDFLLNFGDNNIINAVNIALDKNTEPYSILIKLYQPLPEEFGIKSSFWFVEELSESASYEVEVAPTPIEEKIPFLKSANFDIEVDESSIKPSEYVNINELLSNKSLTAYRELLNAINQKGISINVDYSDYSNFIHFSSAKERLLNFRYKVKLIESYQNDIAAIRTTTNYNTSFNSSESIYSLQSRVDNIVKNFDGYESYLYYASESMAWPKSPGLKPYALYNSVSSQVVNWIGSDDASSNLYGGQLYTASAYDLENQNNLYYTIPEYITLDPVNDSYSLFLNMVGQHFDNIWLFEKAITDQWKNNNNLYKGISKDLVYYALRSLGIKLYNSKSNDNIFNYLIGSSVSGSFLSGNPSNTYFQVDTDETSYLEENYYEQNYNETGNIFVTASQYTVPGQDIQKEILKRVYHNLPYLLKSRGTSRGLKALITTFGITGSILTVNEFGGTDKLTELNAVYSPPSLNKVRILNNTITGSVLSPILRLEETPTENLIKDVHFIEAGFSPQNEINNQIISLYSSSFNIDEYIGDPRDDQKTTYPTLVEFNYNYYSSSGYFREYDIKDFVRLIQFFDNSLFKMIKDYVPARTNIQTGLIIKSPIIERPKAKRTDSDVSENYNSFGADIQSGEIEANSIYVSGYGDGRDFYLGELSGSVINIYADFEIKNRNPYI